MDIKGLFQQLDHEWIVRFIELRIKYANINRLFGRMLKAGIMNNYEFEVAGEGSGQVSVCFLIIFCIYIHYVLVWQHTILDYSKVLFGLHWTSLLFSVYAGIFVIFPCFVMHKAITTLGNQDSMKSVKDKSEYGFVKLVALNLTSIAGFVQVLMTIAVVFNIMKLFTISYFILNFMVMVVSLKSILI